MKFSAPQELARNLGFTEGPLWSERHGLLLVGLSRGMVHRVDPQSGSVSTFMKTGGRPNGLAEDSAGRVWIAQAGSERASDVPQIPPSIQCVTDSALRTVLDSGFNAPNDLIVGPGERLWFTDPAGSAFDEQVPPGRLWSFDIGKGSLALAHDHLRFPNGLAFSPRDGALYVAETALRRVVRLKPGAGAEEEPEPFAVLPEGHPDGIAFDSDGFLYAAGLHAHAVFVFNTTGALAARIGFEDGSMPTNLCLGARGELYVTVAKGGRIFRVRREG
jgi:gluconolactonase